MPQFSESTLEQVRAIGIEKIVEPYVELRQKSGSRDLWGLCPFHNENSPSFKVDLERGFFKCFGCDAKGDGITFIMRRLGFSYPDAIVFIAERFGVNIEYVGEENKNGKDIIALHEDIQIMLRKNLYADMGKEAKKYILDRVFTDEDLDEFGVGYIPSYADFDTFYRKYPFEVLTGSGFFKEGRAGTPSARFFNRLTLPIKGITGSIAAFAGRSLDGSDPKYLNSAESGLFHKRETLFNIDKAKQVMKTAGKCLIVEGYFDVMRLHKLGYRNAVAPMGTALTANQASLLRRYSEDITVIFDGDEAGEKAAYRSLGIFIEAGIFPKAVFLPKEDDPDSFGLREGKEGLDKVLSERDDLFLYVSRRLARQAGSDFSKKLIRFQSVKKMLASVNDPHLRDHYSEAAADIFGLKKDNVTEDVANAMYERSSAKWRSGSVNKKQMAAYPCEMDFIACLTLLPVDVIDKLVYDMPEEMFKDENIRNIFKKILEVYASIDDIKELVPELGDDFVELASREITGDPYKIAFQNKERIVWNHLKQRQLSVIEELKNASGTDAKILLLKELDELTRKIVQGDVHRGDL